MFRIRMLGGMWGFDFGRNVGFMSGFKSTGPHKDKRLTALTVRNASKPGLYGDGNGLYLKVDAGGAKRWIQRVVINRKRKDIGLGSITLRSLSEARELALENRKCARNGGDPLAAKRLKESILTFEEAAKEVHSLNRPTWRNAKHADQWINTLETFAFPYIGRKRIDTVTGEDILAVLTPIWNAQPETARRVKQRIGSIMKWAMAKGWRIDNPAEAMSMALPKHDRSKIQHRKALPYTDVSNAIRKVWASDAGAITKLAFEFLVLTAARSGEVREA